MTILSRDTLKLLREPAVQRALSELVDRQLQSITIEVAGSLITVRRLDG